VGWIPLKMTGLGSGLDFFAGFGDPCALGVCVE